MLDPDPEEMMIAKAEYSENRSASDYGIHCTSYFCSEHFSENRPASNPKTFKYRPGTRKKICAWISFTSMEIIFFFRP
jgi:hypothetical protein